MCPTEWPSGFFVPTVFQDFPLGAKKPPRTPGATEATRNEGSLTAVSLSIVGYWNRMIFTPTWVGDNLFEAENAVEASVPFMPNDPIRYKDENVQLSISGSNLILVPVNISKGSLPLVENMGIRVLDRLPDTPIRAVTISFEFGPIRLGGQLSSLFDGPDRPAFKNIGWSYDADRIVRHFRKNDERLLVVISRESGSITANFNFHNETANCRVAVKELKGKLASYLRDSQRILGQVYQAKLSPIP